MKSFSLKIDHAINQLNSNPDIIINSLHIPVDNNSNNIINIVNGIRPSYYTPPNHDRFKSVLPEGFTINPEEEVEEVDNSDNEEKGIPGLEDMQIDGWRKVSDDFCIITSILNHTPMSHHSNASLDMLKPLYLL